MFMLFLAGFCLAYLVFSYWRSNDVIKREVHAALYIGSLCVSACVVIGFTSGFLLALFEVTK